MARIYHNRNGSPQETPSAPRHSTTGVFLVSLAAGLAALVLVQFNIKPIVGFVSRIVCPQLHRPGLLHLQLLSIPQLMAWLLCLAVLPAIPAFAFCLCAYPFVQRNDRNVQVAVLEALRYMPDNVHVFPDLNGIHDEESSGMELVTVSPGGLAVIAVEEDSCDTALERANACTERLTGYLRLRGMEVPEGSIGVLVYRPGEDVELRDFVMNPLGQANMGREYADAIAQMLELL